MSVRKLLLTSVLVVATYISIAEAGDENVTICVSLPGQEAYAAYCETACLDVYCKKITVPKERLENGKCQGVKGYCAFIGHCDAANSGKDAYASCSKFATFCEWSVDLETGEAVPDQCGKHPDTTTTAPPTTTKPGDTTTSTQHPDRNTTTTSNVEPHGKCICDGQCTAENALITKADAMKCQQAIIEHEAGPTIKQVLKDAIMRNNSDVQDKPREDLIQFENVARVDAILAGGDLWNEAFPKRTHENDVYEYVNLLRAIAKFPAVCRDYGDETKSKELCLRLLATMFAHFTQETGGHSPQGDESEGLMWINEMGCHTATGDNCPGYGAPCDDVNNWAKYFTCPTPRPQYYGRGSHQISYPYNYGWMSESMYGDRFVLLDHPEKVASSWLGFASAVWFDNSPQSPKPSLVHVIDGTYTPNEQDKEEGRVRGFGLTTMIINGGIECGGGAETAQSANRIRYYKHHFALLKNATEYSPDLEYTKDGWEPTALGCAGMQAFSSSSSTALNMYWDQDWGYNPVYGKSYRCRLVNYQTFYNIFKPDGLYECIQYNFPNSTRRNRL